MGSSTTLDESLNFNTISIGGLDNIWTLEFDGSFSSTESGVGIVLVSTNGKKIPFYFKLKINNTNNIVEYESLLLGMNVTQKK